VGRQYLLQQVPGVSFEGNAAHDSSFRQAGFRFRAEFNLNRHGRVTSTPSLSADSGSKSMSSLFIAKGLRERC
jgi:hypothetical protein